MALSGNYISFQSIIESVYRKAGYQNVDINEAVEVIGETIRSIGVLPAFKDVTTSGVGGNPVPLTVTDFRAQLPADCLQLIAVRKVELTDSVDSNGNAVKRITSFYPMNYSTDLFFKSTADMNESLTRTTGSYDALATKIAYTITVVGTSGTMRISSVGNMDRTMTWDTDIPTTIDNFITLYAADYALINITVTRDGDDIVFTETVAGEGITKPEVYNLSGNLNGVVERTDTPSSPVIVESPKYQFKSEHGYSYRLDNSFIHTNFESGYIELTYRAFIVDSHGFPMVPDDQRYIDAVRWSIIEHIDYKKWRAGELPRDVYEDTDQKKSFYVRSAISKASVPSPAEMESIKNMLLRSIKDFNAPDSYFKYNNLPERRYNHNS